MFLFMAYLEYVNRYLQCNNPLGIANLQKYPYVRDNARDPDDFRPVYLFGKVIVHDNGEEILFCGRNRKKLETLANKLKFKNIKKAR